jgi:hypothetical protein
MQPPFLFLGGGGGAYTLVLNIYICLDMVVEESTVLSTELPDPASMKNVRRYVKHCTAVSNCYLHRLHPAQNCWHYTRHDQMSDWRCEDYQSLQTAFVSLLLPKGLRLIY